MTRQKYGGRQKGTKNKVTADLKEVIKELLSIQIKQLPIYIENLSNKDKIDVIIKLIPYVVPKQTESEINLYDNNIPLVIVPE